MKLLIPIIEVQQFLSNHFQIEIDIKNIEVNKIEATYIDSVVLILKEVKENVISLRYEADGLAHLVTKAAHFFLNKKLADTPIEWDSKNEEVTIDLNKIQELTEFLKFVDVSELQIKNDIIAVVLYVRDKA